MFAQRAAFVIGLRFIVIVIWDLSSSQTTKHDEGKEFFLVYGKNIIFFMKAMPAGITTSSFQQKWGE